MLVWDQFKTKYKLVLFKPEILLEYYSTDLLKHKKTY